MPSPTTIDRHRKRHPEWAARLELRKKGLDPAKLIAEIKRLVPAYLPADMQDDVTSDVVADVLAGKVTDLKAGVKAAMTRHNAMSGRWKETSLNAPIAGTDDLRRIDLLDEHAMEWLG